MTDAARVPQSLRLVALLPTPFSLSDYEPCKPLGAGAFGVNELTDVSAQRYAGVAADLVSACAWRW